MNKIHFPQLALAFLVLVPALASAADIPTAPAATADMSDLVFKAGCTACHAAASARIGPAFIAIAGLYHDSNEDTVQRLATKIRWGGAGNWGVVPMPANPQISEENAVRIVHWILNRGPASVAK